MVEVDMGFVMDKARTIMKVYNTPMNFWGYAIMHAIDTINLTHVPMNTNKTAHEMVFKNIPDVSHLLPFYARAMYNITKEERIGKGSFSNKRDSCRILGYSTTSKNTYIIRTDSGKIIERKDVIAQEKLYIYLQINESKPNIENILERLISNAMHNKYKHTIQQKNRS